MTRSNSSHSHIALIWFNRLPTWAEQLLVWIVLQQSQNFPKPRNQHPVLCSDLTHSKEKGERRKDHADIDKKELQKPTRIGDDIEMTVLNVTGNQVRIGIDAPEEIPVHQEEVYQRILEETA